MNFDNPKTFWKAILCFAGAALLFYALVLLIQALINQRDNLMLIINDPANLAILFSLLVNAALVGALLGKLALLYTIVARFSPSPQERIMRSIASVAGCLLYLGAKTFGISVPTFMLYAITEGGAIITGLVAALAPAAVGLIMAWYVTGYLNSRNARRNLVGMRLLAMIMTIVFFLYADVYFASAGVALHADSLRLLMPNVTFALAVMLYAVFRFHPLPEEAAA
jgi:hypothetical protein